MTRAVGRERGWQLLALIAAIACAVAFFAAQAQPAAAASQRGRIDATVRQALATQGLNAVLVQVTVRGKTVIKRAYGQSLAGVPATTDMHFRTGNVAAPYITTLLLRLVDRKKTFLNTRVSKYLPWLRDSNKVTLGMLAGMTAGYHDYEQDPALASNIYANPFGVVSTNRKLQLALSRPLQFSPGTNWSYAHSDYVILGLALEKITKMSLNKAISKWVLKPLHLRNTRASETAAIPEPVLHTFSSERKTYLGIPPQERFIEETTFWNPAWSFPRGSVETSTIGDTTRGLIAVGTGKLLSKRSHRIQVDPRVGFGHAVPKEQCEDCRQLTRDLGYGLGVFRYGSWIAAQPLFAGLGSVAAYLPSKRVSIVVTAALGEGAFDADGNGINYSQTLFKQIGAIVAPKDPPPQ
jgi:CubicO group peptidase (beta-lactamase class C family)